MVAANRGWKLPCENFRGGLLGSGSAASDFIFARHCPVYPPMKVSPHVEVADLVLVARWE